MNFERKITVVLIIILMFMSFSLKVNASEVILEMQLDSINGIRYSDYLVYYDYKTNKTASPANTWGYEVAFTSEGIAVEADTNVKIPIDGFALSGHGQSKTKLMDIKIGDMALVDLDKMNVKIIRDELSANKFRANIRLNEIINLKDSLNSFGYQHEEEEFLTKNTSLENLVIEINQANLDDSNLLINEINNLADELIYMASPTKLIEVRGIWHRPFATLVSESSLSGIIRLMDKFKELGFNTIYLETFWNGHVSYNSKILKTHPRVGLSYYGSEYGYDYVKAFIGEANKRDIDVHAWLHTFSAGSSELSLEINETNEKWLVKDYQGRVLHPNVYGGSFYLDPSNPEVLDFIETILVEITENYDFKGIQYDYIRYYDSNFNNYPILDSGYNETAETRFKETYNLIGDVRTLIKDIKIHKLWNEWRMANITNAVKRFSKKIHSLKPQMIISAAVVSDLNSARNTYMQDWFTWVKAGYLDMLCPMIYTGSSLAVENATHNILDKIANLSYLISGIAPIYYGYSTMVSHKEILATAKASGNAIFASQNVIGNLQVEESLKQGRYRNTAINISKTEKEIIEFSLNNLKLIIYELIEKGLVDNLVKDILITEINNILSMKAEDPGELSNVLKRINVLSNLTLYIDNDASSYLKSEIDSLYQVIDIKISRYLINNDYWDPNSNSRPDPTSFKYPQVEEDKEIEENNPKEERTLKYYLLGLISIIIISINSYLFYRRKRTK